MRLRQSLLRTWIAALCFIMFCLLPGQTFGQEVPTQIIIKFKEGHKYRDLPQEIKTHVEKKRKLIRDHVSIETRIERVKKRLDKVKDPSKKQRLNRKLRRLKRGQKKLAKAKQDPNFPKLKNVYILTLKSSYYHKRNVILEQIKELPYIEYAHFNSQIIASELPNDWWIKNPDFTTMKNNSVSFISSYSDNWGPLVYFNGAIPSFSISYSLEKPALYGLKNIGMEEVWTPSFPDAPSGNGVLVAVLDTGIDRFHPDLKNNIASYTEGAVEKFQKDFICEGLSQSDACRNITDEFDFSGHGTGVAGVIAAQGSNKLGGIGVAHGAKILSVKILNDLKQGTIISFTDGLRFAIDQQVDIINLSLVFQSSLPIAENNLLHDLLKQAKALDIFIVGSAGDSNKDIKDLPPPSYPEVFSVSSVDWEDARPGNANFGETLDVVAPGRDILSTVSLADKNDITHKTSHYGFTSGASMATPFVSGLAALLLSKNPDLNPDQLAHIIRAGATDILDTGKDVFSGHGRIHAPNSLAILEDTTAPTVTELSPEEAFTSDNNTIHLDWEAVDLESGIIGTANSFQVAVGSSAASTDVLAFTSVTGNSSYKMEKVKGKLSISGLNLDHGKEYFMGLKVQNGMGQSSSSFFSSTGVMVDLTPPTTPVIKNSKTFSIIDNVITISWLDSVDTESGVSQSRYALVNSKEELISNWTVTDNTTVTSQNIHFSGLVADKGYFVAVQVMNKVGLWSDTAFSGNVVFDLTAPTIPTVKDSGPFSITENVVTVSWSDAVDPESGVSQSRYAAVSSKVDSISSWTVTDNTTISSKNITFPALTEGQDYFVAVQVMNKAGLWSNTGFSDGITMAFQKPVINLVTDEFFTSKNSEIDLDWGSLSQHSIIKAQYAIGLSETSSNIQWKDCQSVTSLDQENLSLSKDQTNFLFVRIQRDSGLWSDHKVRALTLDQEKPQITTLTYNDETPGEYAPIYGQIKLGFSSSDNHKLASYLIKLYRLNTPPSGIIASSIQATQSTGFSLVETISVSNPTAGDNTATFTESLRDNNKFFTTVTAIDAAGNSETSTQNIITFFNAQRATFDRVFSYPNPLNPETQDARIQFFLEIDTEVSLYIHALNGEILHSESKNFTQGLNEFVWNGQDAFNNRLANGVYLAYLVISGGDSGNNKNKIVKIAILR